MIHESSYWKEPLLESATWFRRIRLSENTTDRTLVKIEKSLFVGFYSIRKLTDTLKISDATKQKEIDLAAYKCKKRPHYFDRFDIDEIYDLDRPASERKDISFVCNLFIHSYVFAIAGHGKMEGVYITTDRYKDKKLYFVSTDQIVELFRLVGRDYPNQVHSFRNEETDEWEHKVGNA